LGDIGQPGPHRETLFQEKEGRKGGRKEGRKEGGRGKGMERGRKGGRKKEEEIARCQQLPCNSNYSGGRDQEDQSTKTNQT
jgi:hypothetical protein